MAATVDIFEGANALFSSPARGGAYDDDDDVDDVDGARGLPIRCRGKSRRRIASRVNTRLVRTHAVTSTCKRVSGSRRTRDIALRVLLRFASLRFTAGVNSRRRASERG